MKYLSLCAIPFLAFGSQASAAEIDVYHCSMTKAESLISEELIFMFDPETNTHLVQDGIIHFVEGEPIQAELGENTDKKLVLKWSVLLPDSSGQIARLSYRLAYFKQNSKVLVSVQAMGFANQYSGRGACQKSKATV